MRRRSVPALPVSGLLVITARHALALHGAVAASAWGPARREAGVATWIP
jgi:hypothetical protein